MATEKTPIQAFRASILYFTDDPEQAGVDTATRYIEDGLLIIENGLVQSVGAYTKQVQTLPESTEMVDHSGKLILPGFVDTHLHFPQTDIIASYGQQLMAWLEHYAFPVEGRFSDSDYAAEVAAFFFDELLRNGTTSAQVMSTVHPQSVETLFQAALLKNIRLISGKTLMNCNAPGELLEDNAVSIRQTQDLIEKWHGRKRLSYAVSPRFAVTSTESQLEAAGELFNSRMGLYMQTHLAENREEVAMIQRLFPWSRDYLDVYERFDLVGPRSTFAHAIHLSDGEWQRLAASGAAISFCPTSNLFIGSGLFNLQKAAEAGIPVGLGSDVGGGTSFSMLKTMAEAYKVLQLQGQSLSPLQAFYLATLGSARALQLDEKIGTLLPGREADFIVLNFDATPLIERRISYTQTLQERLFVLMTLGDERCISGTYIMGRLQG